jgi:hypothetical protein
MSESSGGGRRPNPVRNWLRAAWARPGVLALVLLNVVTLGLLGVQAAQAAGGRQVYVRNGTGALYYLSGPTSGFWGPVSVTGPSGAPGAPGATGPQGERGPRGPKGEKGDPGSSQFYLKQVSVHLTSSSPASQTVTMSGLPKFSISNPENTTPLTNAAGAPAGATITVTRVTPSAGATSRSFVVTHKGLGSNGFDLTITVFGGTP